MKKTTRRGDWQRLAQADVAREQLHLDAAMAPAPRAYRWWQRAISAVVAATLFVGPITVTVEQGRAAAGVVAAGSKRLDDEAWRVVQDLATLRVSFAIRLAMQVAEAAPIVDPRAPISFQPTLTQSTGAGGGVPVVNITAPNSAGISLNQYQSFNIDPVGLILNNSLMSGTSLTGGNVAANPKLNGRTASVIVNQVTSTGTAFASLLNGPLEVFGAPANVIIANPNGIATQGTGFTNTIGVTLTTGTPQFLTGVGGTPTDFTRGQTLGYNVTGGHIQIEGNAGVNGPGSGIEGTVGTIDLIGETIGVNAPLYAGNRINAIAGRQFVSPTVVADTGTTYATSSNGSVNTAAAINAANGANANHGLAIDATAFGAMTAGQIQVIGTAAGMGVRTDAQLAANASDLTLSANGDVTMAGSAAQKQLSVQSSGNVTLTGAHAGIGGYAINASGDVTSTGTLQSGGDVSINAGGNITTDGNVNLDGNLALSSGQTTTIASQATAKQAVTLTAGQGIAVTGALASGTSLNATARGAFSVPGSLLVGTDATIGAASFDVPGVLIAQRNGSVNSQGNITSSGSMAFGQNGTLTAANDVALTGKLLANGLQVNAGNSASFASVQAGGAFNVTANGAAGGGDVTFNGNAATVGNTAVTAARDVLVNGTLAGGAQVGLTAARNVTVATAGTVQSVGDTTIAATTGSVTSTGSLQSSGKLAVQGAQNVSLTGSTSAVSDTTLTAGNDLTTGGSLAGKGGATLTAGHDANLGGNNGFTKDTTVNATHDVNVTGSLQGNAVALNAGNAATLNNVQANGALTVTTKGSAGSGDIAVNGKVASLASGTLNAARNLAVNGTLTTATGLTATAASNTSIAGTVKSNGNVTFTNTSGSLTSTGSIAAGGDLSMNAAQSIALGTTAAQSSTSALGNLALSAGQNLTMNGSLVNQGNSTLTAGGTIGGAGSLAFGLAAILRSGGDTNLTESLRAATIQTNAGGTATFNNVQAGSTLALNAQQDLNTTGAVNSGATVALNAGQNLNVGGSLQSAGDANLSATSGAATSTGTIASNGGLNVQAGTDVNLGGTATAALDTKLTATRDVNVTGTLNGKGNGALTAGRDIGGTGKMTFAQAATLTAGRNVAQGGLVQGNAVLVSAAKDASVNSVESATTLNLVAGTSGAGNLTVNSAAGSAGALVANAAGDVTISQAGKLAGGSTVGVSALNNVNVAGAIESVGDATLKAQQGSLNATGGLNSGGKLSITTGLDALLGASTTAMGDLNLNAGRDAQLNGTLVGQANGTISAGRDITGAGTQSITQTALITAQRDIALTGKLQANTVQVTGTDSAALNNVTSSTTLTLTANGNAGNGDASITGVATAPGAVTLTAARDVMIGGTLGSGDTATLTGKRNVTVTAGAGGVSSTNDLNVTATNGTAALAGTTKVGGALAVTSGLDTQLGGTLAVTKGVTVGAGRDVNVTGALAGQQGGTLTAARDITGAGSAAFGRDATVMASHDVALTGSLQGANVTVTGANNAGLGSAQATTGNLAVTAKGNAGGGDVTFGGAATAFGTMTLQAARDVGVTGAANAGGVTTVSATRNATLGSVNSTGDLTIGAGGSIGVAGTAKTNGNLTATAGNDLSMGAVLASGAVALQAKGGNGAGDVSVTGTLGSGAAATVTAARDVTVGGNVSTGGKTTVTASRNLTVGGNVGLGGDAALTATNGNLSVTGTTASTGKLNASAGSALAMGGSLVNGDVTLTSGGAATLTGAFYGLGALNVHAGGAIAGGGALTFTNDITLNAVNGGMTLGAIDSTGQLTATANGDMTLGATTAKGNVTATSQAGSVTFNGAVLSGGNAQIQAANDVTVTGSVGSKGALNVKGTNGNVTVGGASSNGDASLTAGKKLTLSGTSVVAGQVDLSGHDVTLSGSVLGSKNVTVSAQGTLDSSAAQLVSTHDMQLSGADVTLGNVLVGGALNANASNQLALVGKTVGVAGNTTFSAQKTFSNSSNVFSGGALKVSAPNVVNAAKASLASQSTATITATNLTNAGVVSGVTTNVSVANALTNGGGSLMGMSALTINTGSLNNANGLIFAGNPTTPNGPVTGDVSLTITGGNAAYYNANGQLLAQRNFAIDAEHAALDLSQGTISQGGQLSITANAIDVTGTWNYGGQGVSVNALNGMTNSGTISGTAPLTLTTGGTFTNSGQVTGNDVTLNGTLNNAANALVHADHALAINGNVTNRGTVEAGSKTAPGVGSMSATGWSYDNQGGTTQAQGDATFNLTGTLQNTGGSIFAGHDISINAASVVNDQTAPSGSATTTTTVIDSSLLLSAAAGTETYWQQYKDSSGSNTFNASLGTLLSPTGMQLSDAGPSIICTSCSQPVAGSGAVTFNEYNVQVGESSQTGDARYANLWYVGTSPDPKAIASKTLILPDVHASTTTLKPGTSGVISAGGSISLTANSLSNQGGQISALGNVSLKVQALSNGAVMPTVVSQTTEYVDANQLSSFFAQLKSLGTIAVKGTGNPTGTICDADHSCAIVDVLPPTMFDIAPGAAPTANGTITSSFPTGTIVAGNNMTVAGGNLVNAGLLYAGNVVDIQAQTLTNQGGNRQNYSSQVGCASGVPNYVCGFWGHPRGDNPTGTTFTYTQDNATIYAGHDLVIASGQVNNTYGNLLAGHDIVISGVGSTAGATVPATSLNNTSGNIVAGNDITLNVSGAITNTLPPPVQIHENYGKREQYNGCMTAGGYKESYCESYVDQQSGNSSTISAGNNLQINAGSLTNIGSLISAGTSAKINVAGPVVNEAQTLNAYWHSHWVQETGDFSDDKRHDIWACGSVADCTALYGDAYTHVGGVIDPPQPVGNIAATIQAPNLSINSAGEIQNVGNVLGTSVALTGQKLINGITKANTYTPLVNAPSQVIALSPLTLPGLHVSLPHVMGTGGPEKLEAGKASYFDAPLVSSAGYSAQNLLDKLPSSLQPGTTLFYYNPQEEDLLLQQVAMQQTGKAAFVDGLSYDSQNQLSVTEQEKGYLYGNALKYANANGLKLGQALTQAQVSALDKPMLWYVEQTVPDPSCTATGVATCPMVTALMPQVYLPANASALSAGGNIVASDSLKLDFGDAKSGGSVLNTGMIASAGSLTVNTGTLTNRANQVDVGQVWANAGKDVDAGYEETTGTRVQPGGFMSAAAGQMSLNVAQLNQIGGLLQEVNPDG
ncbi:filamentous hemagglutinin N-terminal domain-containing protein, partial [Trinickia fusca]